MDKVHKEYDGDSGPDWILNLEGPDGNVYYLWALLEKYIDTDAIEESKNYPPYEGYESVLDYCLYNLTGCPAAIEFRMYGNLIQQVVPDYRDALRNNGYETEQLRLVEADDPDHPYPEGACDEEPELVGEKRDRMLRRFGYDPDKPNDPYSDGRY